MFFNIRDVAGLHFEFEPGVAADLENTTVGLSVSGLSIRNLLDLLMAYGGGLTWEERGEGTVVIRRKPGNRPRPAPEPPWFGGPGSMFAAPFSPPPTRPVPSITLPAADMARPLLAAREPIEILVAVDGSRFLGGTPVASEFALWLALLEYPDIPVLVRADARAPLAVVLGIRDLAPGREAYLATGRADVLPLPDVVRHVAVPPEALYLVCVANRLPVAAAEVYRGVWHIWKANARKTLVLGARLPKGTTVGDGAALMNEAERFGCISPSTSTRGPGGLGQKGRRAT